MACNHGWGHKQTVAVGREIVEKRPPVSTCKLHSVSRPPLLPTCHCQAQEQLCLCPSSSRVSLDSCLDLTSMSHTSPMCSFVGASPSCRERQACQPLTSLYTAANSTSLWAAHLGPSPFLCTMSWYIPNAPGLFTAPALPLSVTGSPMKPRRRLVLCCCVELCS